MLKTFKNQLTAFTISIILLISLIFALLCYTFIYRNILSIVVSYHNQLTNQLSKNIELFLDGIIESTDSLSRTSSLRFYGSNFITPGIVPSRDEIKGDLWKTIMNEESIDDISVVYKQEKLISLYNMYEGGDLLKLCDYYSQHQNKNLYTTQFVPMIHYSRNGHPALSCMKLINSSDSPCYIISTVTVDEIFQLMQTIDLGEGSGACLADSNGSIQYSTLTDQSFQSDMIVLIQEKDFSTDCSFISSLNGQKYILSIYPLFDSTLSAVVYIPLSNVTKELLPLLLSMLGSILLMLFLFIGISIHISGTLTKPIITLTEHISNLKDYRTNDLPSVSGTRETQILFSSFQGMLQRIQELMKKIDLENESKRKAELSALQSQINPHFLYNTLDSINALAILNDEAEISKMITSLGMLLRLSIGNPDKYLTLRDEFSYVQAYIAIQKIRYEDSFSVDFHMDSSIAAFPVIRLILQPLVENSIYHGLEPLEREGYIGITATDCLDHIEIKIEDNGMGTTPEAEKAIQQNLAQRTYPGTTGSVGIYNVNERLRLHYGEKAFLTFCSSFHVGTTVTLFIPKEDLENVENHVG